jgi:Cu2+-exporting ATPase
MAEQLDLSLYVKRAEDGAARMDLAIEGITCAACLDDIERGLARVPGVTHARLNLTTHRLAVSWDEQRLRPADIVAALKSIGYGAYPFEQRRVEAEEEARSAWLLKCLGVAAFASMNIMLLSVSVWSGNVSGITQETRDFFHWCSALIALPAAAYAGQPFFTSAMTAIRSGRLNMDVPISLGVLLALGMSVYETLNHAEHAYFDSAVMLLLFLLAGRYLDQAMRRKTRAAAGNLAALKGEAATRLGVDETGAETLTIVPVAALQSGDRVLVRPGERVPADALVVSGKSQLDESLITGETDRRAVEPGAGVYAGSVNFDGALTLQVTAAASGSLIDEVGRLLETAGEARTRYMRLADRAARLYAPVVHVTALLTCIGWLVAGAGLHDALITAIAVLIITCPCALALAVPAVQVVASGALFHAGVYLNSPEAIEKLAEVDVAVFDKTGTLTLPEPRVANAADIAPDLLANAARLALSSHHPLAAAVAREAGRVAPFAEAVEKAGQGVEAIIDGQLARLGAAAFCGCEDEGEAAAGASSLWFSHAGRSTRLLVRQTLRVDARAVIDDLRAQGLAIHILSGDRPSAVEPVARALGVVDWRGGLKPQEKIAAIEALKQQGRRVLMVGDGLNDAPALAAAHCSLSPITAVDMAQGQADAVFLGEKLAPVAQAVDIARRARALMRQNLWLAVVYNFIAVPLAIAGFVTPLIAAAAMSGSSVLVTLNALRLRAHAIKTPSDAPAPRSGATDLALAERTTP